MSRSAAARKFTVIEKRCEPQRTLRGWAIGLLLETGAIRECIDHSHLCDATDPGAGRARSPHVIPLKVHHRLKLSL